MITAADVLTFLNTVAPPSMRESWDSVGINCGRTDREVRRILVALDPFEEVCLEAKENDVQLLITHHALIFRPGFVTDENVWGKNVLFLIENGITHINAHTNLDYAPGGVNDILAQTLGLADIHVISPAGTDATGSEWGLLRGGTVPRQPLEDFLAHVKAQLDCPGLRYISGGKPVQRVAVGGGACAGELRQVIAAGFDTFVTADVKYNQFRDAMDAGINLIDAGHFHTERPVCQMLARKLQQAFPQIQVLVSKKQADYTKFF